MFERTIQNLVQRPACIRWQEDLGELSSILDSSRSRRSHQRIELQTLPIQAEYEAHSVQRLQALVDERKTLLPIYWRIPSIEGEWSQSVLAEDDVEQYGSHGVDISFRRGESLKNAAGHSAAQSFVRCIVMCSCLCECEDLEALFSCDMEGSTESEIDAYWIEVIVEEQVVVIEIIVQNVSRMNVGNSLHRQGKDH